jgi:hypothetical protein
MPQPAEPAGRSGAAGSATGGHIMQIQPVSGYSEGMERRQHGRFLRDLPRRHGIFRNRETDFLSRLGIMP